MGKNPAYAARPKIWDQARSIAHIGEGTDLLNVDRHFCMHQILGAGRARLLDLKEPQLVFTSRN